MMNKEGFLAYAKILLAAPSYTIATNNDPAQIDPGIKKFDPKLYDMTVQLYGLARAIHLHVKSQLER
jgi:hypothetical protein